MKLSGAKAENFLKSPDPRALAILVYGSDRGLVQERIARLIRFVVPESGDPFRVVHIDGAQLRSDPARLADEAATIAMFGGRRVVCLHHIQDSLSKIIASFLKEPKGDALVLVEGDALGPASSLRKLFENADNAAALPCYADSEADLARIIREKLRQDKLEPDPEALDFLIRHLGVDRGVTQSELEKLVLYMGKPGSVHLEDVAAIIGDGAALSLDDFIFAVADGKADEAQKMLERLGQEGLNFVPILRALSRHFQRLQLVSAWIAEGQPPDKAIASLRPQPHFKLQPRFRGQLKNWPKERIQAALELIVAAEIACKTTRSIPRMICSRLALQLAKSVRPL